MSDCACIAMQRSLAVPLTAIVFRIPQTRPAWPGFGSIGQLVTHNPIATAGRPPAHLPNQATHSQPTGALPADDARADVPVGRQSTNRPAAVPSAWQHPTGQRTSDGRRPPVASGLGAQGRSVKQHWAAGRDAQLQHSPARTGSRSGQGGHAPVHRIGKEVRLVSSSEPAVDRDGVARYQSGLQLSESSASSDSGDDAADSGTSDVSDDERSEHARLHAKWQHLL